jgi:hypothetical protein
MLNSQRLLRAGHIAKVNEIEELNTSLQLENLLGVP